MSGGVAQAAGIGAACEEMEDILAGAPRKGGAMLEWRPFRGRIGSGLSRQ
jgi:hypothetical protein